MEYVSPKDNYSAIELLGPAEPRTAKPVPDILASGREPSPFRASINAQGVIHPGKLDSYRIPKKSNRLNKISMVNSKHSTHRNQLSISNPGIEARPAKMP